jgi:predicted transcriptional regulator
MAIKEGNTTISVTLPTSFVNKLQDIADEDDRSRGYIAAKIIKENIGKYEKGGK